MKETAIVKYEDKRYLIPYYRRIKAIPGLPDLPIFDLLKYLPCIFGIEPWCSFSYPPDVWVKKISQPIIDLMAGAVFVADVNIYALSGRITGYVHTRVENKGAEGKEYEQNTTTGEIRNLKNITGSADITNTFDESLIIKALDFLLAKIKNFTEKIVPTVNVIAYSFFSQDGYYSMLQNVFNVLVNGKVYVSDDIVVNASYTVLGETKTVIKTIHLEGDIPVGTVNWYLI